MRLVNVDTLQFREFNDKAIPPYVILSHRWGEGEVSFKDYSKKRIVDGPGFEKIMGLCSFVRDQLKVDINSLVTPFHDAVYSRLDWAWIDTCKLLSPLRLRGDSGRRVLFSFATPTSLV